MEILGFTETEKWHTKPYTFGEELPSTFKRGYLLVSEADRSGLYRRTPLDDLYDFGRELLHLPAVAGQFRFAPVNFMREMDPRELVFETKENTPRTPIMARYSRMPFREVVTFNSVYEGRYPLEDAVKKVLSQYEGGSVRLETPKAMIQVSDGYDAGKHFKYSMEVQDETSPYGHDSRTVLFQARGGPVEKMNGEYLPLEEVVERIKRLAPKYLR